MQTSLDLPSMLAIFHFARSQAVGHDARNAASERCLKEYHVRARFIGLNVRSIEIGDG